MDESAIDSNPNVIRIAADGVLTLSMPEVAGQYLVIEREEGRIILKPYDLRWTTPDSSLTKVGARLHVGPLLPERMPEA